MTSPTKTVLVADDDAAILESVQLLLEMNNYVVITSTGENIDQLVKEHHPDIILLDIWMGAIDGKELCKKIKANSASTHIPILMVSASNDIAKSLADTGASGYVEKPFDIDALIQKIEELTSSSPTIN